MRSVLEDDPDLDPSGKSLFSTLNDKAGLDGDRLLDAYKATDMAPWTDRIMILDILYGPKHEYVDAKISAMGVELVRYFGERTGQLMSEQADSSYVRIGRIVSHVNHTKRPVVGHTVKQIEGKGLHKMVGLYAPLGNSAHHTEQLLIHIALREGNEPMAYEGAMVC